MTIDLMRTKQAGAPSRDKAIKALVALGMPEDDARNLVTTVAPSGAPTGRLVDWPYIECPGGPDGTSCADDHGAGWYPDEHGNLFLNFGTPECPERGCGCVGTVKYVQVPVNDKGEPLSNGPVVVVRREIGIANAAAKASAVETTAVDPKDAEIARLKAEIAAKAAPDASAAAPTEPTTPTEPTP